MNHFGLAVLKKKNLDNLKQNPSVRKIVTQVRTRNIFEKRSSVSIFARKILGFSETVRRNFVVLRATVNGNDAWAHFGIVQHIVQAPLVFRKRWKNKCGFLTEFPQPSNDCTPQTLKIKLVLLSDILHRTSSALRLDSYLSPGS